jgi:hypothetical protein
MRARTGVFLSVLVLPSVGLAQAGDAGATLAGQWPGYRLGTAVSITVSGPYAYLADRGLEVFDVSAPREIRRVASLR